MTRLEDVVDAEDFDKLKEIIKVENGEVKSVDWKALELSARPSETGEFHPEIRDKALSTLCLLGILSTASKGNYSAVLSGKDMNPRISSPSYLGSAKEEILYFTRKEDAEAYELAILSLIL